MNFHPLRSPRPIRSVVLLLLFAGLFFSGCANFEPGSPVAAVTVRASSRFEVMDVVERVFHDAGYRISGRTFDGVTFDKAGTGVDRVMHGNWMGGEVAQRARVAVVDRGNGRYRIRCTPQIVRDPDDDAFEDAHRRMQVVSFHYSSLLGRVKKEFR
jgi:hypothetical protein